MVKATGIVRRIDDLGRVVIPKEIRRTMRIREGDPLEIYTDKDGEVIFKKYSPIGELGTFAAEYTETLSRVSGHGVAICDRDVVIAISGAPKKDLLDKAISSALEEILDNRQTYRATAGDQKRIAVLSGSDRYFVGVCSPIIAGGDIIGSVIFISPESGQQLGEVEIKLAQSASGFLSRHMES